MRRRNTDLPHEVFAAELETIEGRRANAGLPAPGASAEPGPTPERGLVGLALSGGGIRSSTFSLGVVQALSDAGVFARVDYVSTVSGGGYTGSMLSSVLNEPGSSDSSFPLAKVVGVAEPAALQHLRNGSNYLNPGGLVNTLRLPAVVLRGWILNTLLLLPFAMLAVIVTEAANAGVVERAARGHAVASGSGRWTCTVVP